MTPCPRPLDPIDAEAVAAGAEPLFAADAAGHAVSCPACGEAVDSARRFFDSLEAVPGEAEAISGLADRITRLRAFSGRERRTYALWRAPLLLDGALALAGTALLALPVLTAPEQITLTAAAAAPFLVLARAAAGWAWGLVGALPAGLGALSETLPRQNGLGLAALAVLVPAGLGLRRVLARAPGRR